MCVGGVLTACKTDEHALRLFGESGAALLAAYDGICGEADKDAILVCAATAATTVTAGAMAFQTSVDALAAEATANDTCLPMATLHASLTVVINGACITPAHQVAYENLLKAVEFPCKDVTSTYYPCTVAQINTDAIACYNTSGVTVTNGFVPTPNLAEATTMCSARATIKDCIQTHIMKCAAEPQVYLILGTDGAAFQAGFDCLCEPSNSAAAISCPHGGDVAAAMTTFTSAVHASALAGPVTKNSICTPSLFRTSIITTITSPSVCGDVVHHPAWQTYLDTLGYPCTDTKTSCFPTGAAQANQMGKIILAVTIAITCLLR